jgi:hypothetical protein
MVMKAGSTILIPKQSDKARNGIQKCIPRGQAGQSLQPVNLSELSSSILWDACWLIFCLQEKMLVTLFRHSGLKHVIYKHLINRHIILQTNAQPHKAHMTGLTEKCVWEVLPILPWFHQTTTKSCCMGFIKEASDTKLHPVT